jgi:hypothetical protein
MEETAMADNEKTSDERRQEKVRNLTTAST